MQPLQPPMEPNDWRFQFAERNYVQYRIYDCIRRFQSLSSRDYGQQAIDVETYLWNSSRSAFEYVKRINEFISSITFGTQSNGREVHQVAQEVLSTQKRRAPQEEDPSVTKKSRPVQLDFTADQEMQELLPPTPSCADLG